MDTCGGSRWRHRAHRRTGLPRTPSFAPRHGVGDGRGDRLSNEHHAADRCGRSLSRDQSSVSHLAWTAPDSVALRAVLITNILRRPTSGLARQRDRSQVTTGTRVRIWVRGHAVRRRSTRPSTAGTRLTEKANSRACPCIRSALNTPRAVRVACWRVKRSRRTAVRS